MLMHLKHGYIRFGCVMQLNFLVVLGWVQIFHLSWVCQLMGWVGSGHTKWTHGQLCDNNRACVEKFASWSCKTTLGYITARLSLHR